MKPRHLLLIGSLAAIAVSAVNTSMALANDRYASQPPVKISRDVAAPWLAQLISGRPIAPKANAAPPQKREVIRQKAAPKPRYQQVSQQRPPANPAKTVRKQQRTMDPIYLPQTVAYNGSERPGTIVIDTSNRFLYHVEGNGKARRYGVGVGKQGFGWKGTQKVSRKAKWPTWTPPQAMRERERKKGRILPVQMKGGVNNPLGARALYLGSTLYRIHGTNQPWTIGKAMSSGCFRMRNEDVSELYDRIAIGAQVVVR